MNSDLLREEFRGFRDADGLVSPRRVLDPAGRRASGNGLLYTAQYALILSRTSALRPEDRWELAGVLKACQLIPGLFVRAPGHPDQEGPDDYFGVGLLSSLVDGGKTARKILSYGHLFLIPYYYNNVLPGSYKHPDGRINWSAFLGRFPALIAHLKFSAGESPGIFNLIVWAYSVAFSGDSETQDPWIMTELMVSVGGRYNWLTRLASRIREVRFEKAWPGGMRSVLQSYLNDAEHPLVKYWVDGMTP